MADNADMKSQYLAQVDTDLERNTSEKERIATELAALQAQLTVLEEDHALLTGVRLTLLGESAAPRKNSTPPGVPSADLPRTRRSKSAPRVPEQAAGKKTPPAKTGTGKGSPAGKPTLRTLILAEFGKHSEPRSAAEVTASLAQAHPERRIQTTVVRSTLEGLVAKGQALRVKQKRSVYYTAAPTAPATAADVTSDAASV